MRKRGGTWRFALCAAALAMASPVAAQGPAPELRPDGRALTLFRQGDLGGALELWNRIDQPRATTISIEGAERTRPSVSLDAVSIQPRTLLTRERFERANRRVAELPAASSAHITYQLPAAGATRVTAVVDERSVLPKGLVGWGAVGVRTLFLDDLRVDVSGASGHGEVIGASYRWKKHRPRVALDVAIPAPGPLPGILSFEGLWEKQTYALPELNAGAPFEESHRRITAGLSDWATSWLKWSAVSGVDRIDAHNFVTIGGTVSTRWMDDHVAINTYLARWLAKSDRAAFSAGELSVSWRTATTSDVPLLTVTSGIARVSEAAPLAVWPGASSGKGKARGALLRAHSLLTDDILTGDAFGRGLFFVSAEYEHPVWRSKFGGVGIAGFADAARATLRVAPTPSPFFVDVGGGVRFNTPGAGGKIRLDLGYSPRDGAFKLSAGYLDAWGTR